MLRWIVHMGLNMKRRYIMIDVAQPIRFYLNSDYLLVHKQQHNRYRYYPTLVIDRTHLLPFQILRKDIGADTQALYNQKINIQSIKLYDLKGKYTELVTYLTFKRYVERYTNRGDGRTSRSAGYFVHASVYGGGDTIPAIAQGDHFLVITDDRNPVNTWTSSRFRVCFPSSLVTFEYTNPRSIDYLVHPTTYKIPIETVTFDSSEFTEFIEKEADNIGNEITSFHKIDKLYSCIIPVCDQYVLDALKFMSMHEIIYITDETGLRNEIKIHTIDSQAIARSNHSQVIIKYWIPENQLISTARNSFTLQDYQKGASYIPEDKLLRSRGKIVTTRGKRIKKRN